MKGFFGSQRCLAAYSGVLTLAFAVILLGGFIPDPKNPTFDEHRPRGTAKTAIIALSHALGEQLALTDLPTLLG